MIDFGVGADRLGDRDHRALVGPQPAHFGRGVDLQSDAREQLFGQTPGLPPVDEYAGPTRQRVRQEQVLRHRQLRHQIEMLMHDRDAERLRLLRRSELDRTPADEYGAGGRSAGAANGSDQRRLAGAVFAQQGVHLAAPNGEVDPVERQRSRKLLDQPPDLEHHFRVRRRELRPVRAGRGGLSDARGHACIPMSSGTRRQLVLPISAE